MRRVPVILAHGGAGARKMTAAQGRCLAEALAGGFALLRRGGPAVDAVEATIRFLEASGLFNAGIGSRLQLDGRRRMDASIMEGRRLQAGAVAAIQQVRHPITAARLVMEQTGHVLLVGEQATRFARFVGLECQAPPSPAQQLAARSVQPLAGPLRRSWRLYKAMRRGRTGRRLSPPRTFARLPAERETVGAVALDRSGRLAAGASTGGISVMLPGRVGDTPLIGCGVYADDEAGAVSMTGIGESIIRLAVAKAITDRLAAGAGPGSALRQVLNSLVTRIHGTAGALVLGPDGRFAIRHTTSRMCAGVWNGRGQPQVADRFR